MIEHPHVDEGERLLEPARDEFVRSARLGQPRRMVVVEDDRCRVALEDGFDDLPRMDRGSIDGSAEEIFCGDEAMPVVQVQYAKGFVRLLRASLTARAAWYPQRAPQARSRFRPGPAGSDVRVEIGRGLESGCPVR